jgi:hypothetical protein
MPRHATVRTVSYVSLPDNGQDAWEVRTDFPDPRESAFYLRHDGPKPPYGVTISYGANHASWLEDGREVKTRKVGYNMDPDAPFL